jgi:hypothetical protein
MESVSVCFRRVKGIEDVLGECMGDTVGFGELNQNLACVRESGLDLIERILVDELRKHYTNPTKKLVDKNALNQVQARLTNTCEIMIEFTKPDGVTHEFSKHIVDAFDASEADRDRFHLLSLAHRGKPLAACMK